MKNDTNAIFRLSKEEKIRISKIAKKLGIKPAALMRNRSLGHEPCKNCAYENFPINGKCTCECHNKLKK